MTTARHLHNLIGSHLVATETGTRSQQSVAAFLGIQRTQWARYQRNESSPTESTIDGWLALCRDAGVAVPRTVSESIRCAL